MVWEGTRKEVESLNLQLSEKQAEINRERTQYFEKIALGCGATIALVVSFVGAKNGRLQPPWLLRSSLVVLALAMVSAMYRNWRYPFYVLAVIYKHLDKAMLKEVECKRNVMVTTNALSLQTGEPIDVARVERNTEEAKSILARKIEEFDSQERGVWKEIKFFESTALVLTILGLSLLIWLAWVNF